MSEINFTTLVEHWKCKLDQHYFLFPQTILSNIRRNRLRFDKVWQWLCNKVEISPEFLCLVYLNNSNLEFTRWWFSESVSSYVTFLAFKQDWDHINFKLINCIILITLSIYQCCIDVGKRWVKSSKITIIKSTLYHCLLEVRLPTY